MANRFYDTASAGALSPYNTPETAGATLGVILTDITTTGDSIITNSTSNEAPTTTTTYTFSSTKSTASDPIEVFSVSDFIASPTTLAKGAKILSTTTNVTVSFEGSAHFNGFILGNSATGNNAGSASFGTIALVGNMLLENCSIVQGATNTTTSQSWWGSSVNASLKQYKFTVKNTDFSFGHAGLRIKLQFGDFVFDNISLTGAAASITSLFEIPTNSDSTILIKNSDLTGKTWTNLLVPTSATAIVKMTLENCKIPASIAISSTGTLPTNYEVTLINCDNGDTTYTYQKHTACGSITADSTVYSDTNPLKDKTISVSNKFITTASASYSQPLGRTYMIPIVGNAVGIAITPYIEFLVGADGAAALTNKDVVLKAELLADATTTLGSVVTSHPGLLASVTDIAAGTVTYTGDGYTTERTHRLSTVQITPAQAGFVKLTVQVLKPSTTIYVGVVGVV